MPKSTVSFASANEEDNTDQNTRSVPDVSSTRRPRLHTSLSANHADPTLSIPKSNPAAITERTSLLSDYHGQAYERPSPSALRDDTRTGTPPLFQPRNLSRMNSLSPVLPRSKITSRRASFARTTSGGLSPVFTRSGLRTPKTPRFGLVKPTFGEERVWYDQFTSTDWVRDSIADGYRVLELRQKRGWRSRIGLTFDAAQGWILMAIIGCLVAVIAYAVDILEGTLYDWKRGYCATGWWKDQNTCCKSSEICENWQTWSRVVQRSPVDNIWLDWAGFTLGCVFLAALSCFLTLYSKTVVPSHIGATFDENLGADRSTQRLDSDHKTSPNVSPDLDLPPATAYYSAAGSGVAEVKVILSGFVLHGYLGARTLTLKTCALVLSVASGMSLGKEGPYVHIAACVGNIMCRLFSKYNLNDGKRREVLSASAASGVAVAFGAPIAGVLFSLEEVSYYFPPKLLFRTFFCCIVAALSLKFLNPYGTNKIVLFEVRYVSDWKLFELFCFAILGCIGGLLGALFIKASRFWATTFRRTPTIKRHPMLEVLIVAFVTGILSFWNKYANLAVTELLFELASPCQADRRTGLCPQTPDDIPGIIAYLLIAFVIKAVLTIITFGIKVPAGIYVPSMVVGGLLGRIFGHVVQYIVLQIHSSWVFGHCPSTGNLEACVTPGVYALVAAGATMCGVTRLSVTLAVILFELTGSLDHVLPFSLAVLCAKWMADWVEPSSIYDLLTDMNSYPYLDNRVKPVFENELMDLVPRFRADRLIDISISPLVRASDLRSKLNLLQGSGELDGGLPILRDRILVGLIPAPDLEFALDRIETDEDETLCLMSTEDHAPHLHRPWYTGSDSEAHDHGTEVEAPSVSNYIQGQMDHVDLTPFVDPAPLALDAHSPMDLVYQCFVKLGLRYICVTESGEYRGMVHKKIFVRFVKEGGAAGIT